MRVARTALLALLAIPLTGCWNWNFSRDTLLRPPDRPRPTSEAEGNMPEWMRNPPVSEHELFPAVDGFRAEAEDSFTVVVRLRAPRHALLADRTTIQIDLPIGYSGQPIGLAELAALAVGDTPDATGQRPSLRAWLTELGGDLTIGVEAIRTRFTIHVPTARWETVLNELAERFRRAPITQAQFGVVRDRLIRSRLDQWASDPTYEYASQWNRYGDLDRTEIVSAIQDRYLGEVMLFRQRHYQPEGSVLGIWIPKVSQPRAVVASTRFAMAAWQDAPRPPPMTRASGAATTDPADTAAQPVGVRWVEGEGRSRVAILIPNSTRSLEWRVMLQCFTLGGLGGRLGRALEDKFDRHLVFQVRELGSADRRFLVLEADLDPESIPAVWSAVHEAWKSLSTAAPRGDELASAKARLRLELARRQDNADEWLDAAARRDDSDGPIRDLRVLGQIAHVRGAAQEWAATELAMVVTGGSRPDDAPTSFTTVQITRPTYRRPTEFTLTLTEDTRRILGLAVKAVGDKQAFAAWQGYDVEETWQDPDGLTVKVSTFARPPNHMTRTTEILGTRIATEVHKPAGEPIAGTENAGDEKRELAAGAAAELLSEAVRHPLALLAAWSQNKVEFRLIGMRGRRNRQVAILERVDPTRSRLRITVDTKSGLLRSVETVCRRADVGPVLVRESFDDYRRIGAYRVPMHRVTRVGNDRVGVDCIVNSFKAIHE